MDKLSQEKLVAGVDVQDRIRDARSSSTRSRYSVNIIETQYVSSPSEDRWTQISYKATLPVTKPVLHFSTQMSSPTICGPPPWIDPPLRNLPFPKKFPLLALSTVCGRINATRPHAFKHTRAHFSQAGTKMKGKRGECGNQQEMP